MVLTGGTMNHDNTAVQAGTFTAFLAGMVIGLTLAVPHNQQGHGEIIACAAILLAGIALAWALTKSWVWVLTVMYIGYMAGFVMPQAWMEEVLSAGCVFSLIAGDLACRSPRSA